MNEILVQFNEWEVGVESFKFSGGEVQVKVAPYDSAMGNDENNNTLLVQAELRSSDDIMQLLMVVDALKREYPIAVRGLIIPYFPYARQDRVCNEGEALGAKVMADLINGMGFDEVIVADPHSDVTRALVDGLRVAGRSWYIDQTNLATMLNNGDAILVSPDAGASKATLELAQRYQGEKPIEMVRADKLRNTSTGEITGTIVYGDVKGKTCIIADDICDGGMTFIKLAEKLKEGGAEKVILYVTHGIFSKGVDVILEGGVDYIYSPNIWDETAEENPNVIKIQG